jgi:beta-glucosidase
MTLEEKLDYIGGEPTWFIKPIPRLGVPQIYGTDGTMGFNQDGLEGRPHGPRYPAGIALAASWNVDLARERGKALARDTRARGYHNLLVPGMNFYRTPFNGRNFEYVTGEDPFLGATLAPAVIDGLQGEGVWATAKHLACNDEEINRTNINVVVDERTLREVYLPPFEASVKKARVANVMGAYNFVNGEQCNENSFLLTEVLKNEWGFKGFLESDYQAIHDGLGAALAGCDLDMPAGNFMKSATLLPAIQSGKLSVSLIDDKVRRILREIVSFGFLDRPQFDPSIPVDDPASEAVILNDAREGIVLLKNAGTLLPLESGRIRSVAVLGPNAVGAPPTGFGSSYVAPTRVLSEFDGIQQVAGASVQVDFIDALTLNPQKTVWQSIGPNGQLQAGLKAEYFSSNDLSGSPAVTRVDQEVNLDWTQAGSVPSAIPPSNQATFSARWTGQIVPSISGDQVFKVRADGGFRLVVNGQTIIDLFNSPPLPSPSDVIGPTVPSFAKIPLVAGQAYTVELDYRRVAGFFGIFGGLQGVQLSWAALEPPPSFAKYDAVVLCGGISNEYEGEGIDRPFQLPEFQDELIQNVSRVNPRTVVVLHGGAASMCSRGFKG